MYAVPLYAYGSSLQDLKQKTGKTRQVPEQNPGQSAKRAKNAAGPPVNGPAAKNGENAPGTQTESRIMDLTQYKKPPFGGILKVLREQMVFHRLLLL